MLSGRCYHLTFFITKPTLHDQINNISYSVLRDEAKLKIRFSGFQQILKFQTIQEAGEACQLKGTFFGSVRPFDCIKMWVIKITQHCQITASVIL